MYEPTETTCVHCGYPTELVLEGRRVCAGCQDELDERAAERAAARYVRELRARRAR